MAPLNKTTRGLLFTKVIYYCGIPKMTRAQSFKRVFFLFITHYIIEFYVTCPLHFFFTYDDLVNHTAWILGYCEQTIDEFV